MEATQEQITNIFAKMESVDFDAEQEKKQTEILYNGHKEYFPECENVKWFKSFAIPQEEMAGISRKVAQMAESVEGFDSSDVSIYFDADSMEFAVWHSGYNQPTILVWDSSSYTVTEAKDRMLARLDREIEEGINTLQNANLTEIVDDTFSGKYVRGVCVSIS